MPQNNPQRKQITEFILTADQLKDAVAQYLDEDLRKFEVMSGLGISIPANNPVIIIRRIETERMCPAPRTVADLKELQL